MTRTATLTEVSRLNRIFNGALTLTCLTGAMACADGDMPAGDTASGTGNDNIAAYRYSGPGSFYQASVNDDGSFTIEVSESSDSATLMTISGQYTRLATGFVELEVGAVQSTSPDAPAVGDRAYALELPGFALFLNPAGSSDVIPMLVMDQCPTDDFAANWIMVRGEAGRDATNDDQEWFGGFAYTHGAMPTAQIEGRYNLSNLSALLDAPAAIEVPGCTDGHLPVFEDGRLTANMWLTNGGAIVETFVRDGSKQALVAMRRRPVTSADIAGRYAALFVGETLSAATVSFDTDGAGVATMLMDPSGSQTASAAVTLDLVPNAALGTGWLSGTLQTSTAGNVACSALAAAGQTQRTVVVCIGQDPQNPMNSISILMASTP